MLVYLKLNMKNQFLFLKLMRLRKEFQLLTLLLMMMFPLNMKKPKHLLKAKYQRL